MTTHLSDLVFTNLVTQESRTQLRDKELVYILFVLSCSGTGKNESNHGSQTELNMIRMTASESS